MTSKKCVLIIQARTGSTRFPKKVLKKINGTSLIEHIIYRVKKVKKIDQIVLATTKKEEDDILCKLAKKNKISFFRGSENDLVDRYYKAAINFNAKFILRLPADNPIPEPKEYDRLIKYHLKSKKDFSSNICNFKENGYPDGIGVEIFNFKALEKIWKFQKIKRYREHIALNFYDYDKKKKYKKFSFKIGTIKCPSKISRPELVLDINYRKDLIFIKKIYSFFSKNKNFSFFDVVDWYDNNYLTSF
jgi:spore coat polysaccharide biosynthesis protein SpsF (cytidylyltransferase family)